MADSGEYTPETVARRAKIAEALYANSIIKPQPITHWAEGLAEMGRSALGGYLLNKTESEEKAGRSEANKALIQMLMPGAGGSPVAGAPTGSPAPVAASPVGAPVAASPVAGGNPDFAKGISAIESGGNYGAVGPETGKGRAYGKYQVMDFNIPAWTKEVLGTSMTPQQFVASPQAQDAVFQKKFGDLAAKYGPEGAARAWFAGEGGMNNPNARDVNGMTVANYGRRFAQALGPQAGAGPMAFSGTPQPAQTPAPMPGASPQPAPQAAPAPPMAPQAAPAANPARAQIIQMLQSPNPYVQKQGQALAGQLIGKQVLGSEETNDIKEYNRAVQQGFKGTLFDYQKQLKEAGKPVTNINQQQESEFQKEAGKITAKRYGDYVDEVPQAKQMLSDVQTLTELGKQIGTGKEAQVKAALGPYAQALGINVDKLGEIQAYEAIVNRLAPNLRVKGSGAQSDFELKNFLKSLPSLGNTPEGNELAARVMQGLYQNKLKAGEIGSAVLNGDITRAEADKRIRELPDPMQEWREFSKKAPAASTTGSPPPAAAAPKIRKFNPATGKIE